MKVSDLKVKLKSLTVFRSLYKDPVISALIRFIEISKKEDTKTCIDAYCSFVSLLYNAHVQNLGVYIGSTVNDDENVFIKSIGSKKEISEPLRASVDRELDILQELADLTSSDLTSLIDTDILLPTFENAPVTIKKVYKHRCSNISKFGYGMYSRFYMFYLCDNGDIIPVKNPDPISLDELIDYKREQDIIIKNTNAFLNGNPAANMLLTGDAGTGKSSTIKAVVNMLHTEGLRIIEIRKDQLRLIPSLLDNLSENPLKFILFIDDLSFKKDDDNFSALKATLEGSVSDRSSNTVIYATSNRRHLVKESFDDRNGDDIHRNDTMQEIISLSDRFGLQVTFKRPDKETYLNIVHHLAKEAGIEMPTDELDAQAERFILSRGNRSARAAKQFVDSLICL